MVMVENGYFGIPEVDNHSFVLSKRDFDISYRLSRSISNGYYEIHNMNTLMMQKYGYPECSGICFGFRL